MAMATVQPEVTAQLRQMGFSDVQLTAAADRLRAAGTEAGFDHFLETLLADPPGPREADPTLAATLVLGDPIVVEEAEELEVQATLPDTVQATLVEVRGPPVAAEARSAGEMPASPEAAVAEATAATAAEAGLANGGGNVSDSSLEAQLTEMGFDAEQAARAVAALGSSTDLEAALGLLLAPAAPVSVAGQGAPSGDSLHRAAPEALRRGMSSTSQLVLEQAVSTIPSTPPAALARLLLQTAAALRQGLLAPEQREQLHRQLQNGDVELVQAVVAGLGVRSEPAMPLDVGQAQWECRICYGEQDEEGWRCPAGHRFCSACMCRHAAGATFPRCPAERCRHELSEVDLELLRLPSERLEAFREARLRRALDALGAQAGPGPYGQTGQAGPYGQAGQAGSYGQTGSSTSLEALEGGTAAAAAEGFVNTPATGSSSDVMVLGAPSRVGEGIIRCPNPACGNAVLAPLGMRSRYQCGCGTEAFCTRCRQVPYHFHVDCEQVQPLRRRWLAWLSGDRNAYHGRASASAVFEGQLAALREGLERHLQLEADEQWKAKHCRLCPGCRRPIQKTQGCSSMVCGLDAHGGNQQPGCGLSFDWHSAQKYTAQVESRELPPVSANEVRCRGRTALHPFTDCSLCGTGGRGIVGPRFRCIHCESFDVCSACEPSLGELHERGHVFEVMLESDFAWGGLQLPAGTRVRLVRRGTDLPRDLSTSGAGAGSASGALPGALPGALNGAPPGPVPGRPLEGLCGAISRKRPREEAAVPVYQWGLNGGRWRNYDVAASAAIAAAIRRGQREVHLQIDGRTIVVNTRSMNQRNIATGAARPVRLGPPQATSAAPAPPTEYRVVLDEGGQVLVSAAHLEPLLASRAEAERLLERVLGGAAGEGDPAGGGSREHDSDDEDEDEDEDNEDEEEESDDEDFDD